MEHAIPVLQAEDIDMKGVLVIAHGSRAKETEVVLDSIVSSVKAKLPDIHLECAFMEFSERTIEKGISALAAKGVTEIKIAPYFLFTGIHIKKDIPHMIAECSAIFPGINIIMGEPLGADDRLADILVDRIRA